MIYLAMTVKIRNRYVRQGTYGIKKQKDFGVPNQEKDLINLMKV